jgi:hypothetical protein
LSGHDLPGFAAITTQKTFEEAEHADTKFVAYKGDGPLLSQDPSLTNVIVEWFDTQL